MELKQLLKTLRREKVSKIVIVGTEGSGTTIGAWILAKELKKTYIDQGVFGALNYAAFLEKVKTKSDYVCRCPGLNHCAVAMPSDLFLIAMNRELSDVLTALRRVGFQYGEKERRIYEDYKMFDTHLPMPHTKCEFLSRFVSRARRVEYLDYESMDYHKLFVKKPVRRLFKAGQIMADEETPEIFNFGKA
jgi:hypothetical protein